ADTIQPAPHSRRSLRAHRLLQKLPSNRPSLRSRTRVAELTNGHSGPPTILAGGIGVAPNLPVVVPRARLEVQYLGGPQQRSMTERRLWSRRLCLLLVRWLPGQRVTANASPRGRKCAESGRGYWSPASPEGRGHVRRSTNPWRRSPGRLVPARAGCARNAWGRSC